MGKREEGKRMKDPLAISIGQRLREVRVDEFHEEQAEFAKRLSIKSERYRSYEAGWQVMPTNLLLKTSRITRRPVSWYLGQELDCELTADEWTLLSAYRDIHSSDVKKAVRDLAVASVTTDRRLSQQAPN
jgi:hypothetical protein